MQITVWGVLVVIAGAIAASLCCLTCCVVRCFRPQNQRGPSGTCDTMARSSLCKAHSETTEQGATMG